jgi:hypothetical protein
VSFARRHFIQRQIITLLPTLKSTRHHIAVASPQANDTAERRHGRRKLPMAIVSPMGRFVAEQPMETTFPFSAFGWWNLFISGIIADFSQHGRRGRNQ